MLLRTGTAFANGSCWIKDQRKKTKISNKLKCFSFGFSPWYQSHIWLHSDSVSCFDKLHKLSQDNIIKIKIDKNTRFCYEIKTLLKDCIPLKLSILSLDSQPEFLVAVGKAKEHEFGAKTANWRMHGGVLCCPQPDVMLGEPALPPSLLMQLLVSWDVWNTEPQQSGIKPLL